MATHTVSSVYCPVGNLATHRSGYATNSSIWSKAKWRRESGPRATVGPSVWTGASDARTGFGDVRLRKKGSRAKEPGVFALEIQGLAQDFTTLML